MTQSAHQAGPQADLQAASPARFVAADPRADDGSREISITAEAVTIDRRVGGVKMRVRLLAANFRGVALGMIATGRGFVYRVALVHADCELDVVLAESESDRDIGREWLAWAQYFRLPRLTLTAGGEAVVERRIGEVDAREAQPRRRGWPLKHRRSAISGRRGAGQAGASAVHRGEREIVCYE